MAKKRRLVQPGDVVASVEEDEQPSRFPPPVLPGEPIARIGLDLKAWKPAHEVLDYVTVVPTIFPDFDRRSTVGGFPVRRVHTISGPTHQGKSAFILGLIESFLRAGHVAGYIDAEHATGLEFTDYLLSTPKHPNFYARRPENYEQTIDDVDELIAGIQLVREGKKAHGKRTDRDYKPAVPGMPDLCSLLAVDSITKLVPKREIKNMLESADKATKGEAGMRRAAVNQTWLDSVVPRLHLANMAFVLVAQEREEVDSSGGGFGTKFSEDLAFHVKGGSGIQFDASMLMRITKRQAYYDVDAANGSGRDEEVQKIRKGLPIVGWTHKIRIRKSKVGAMESSYTDCYFHMSTGRGMAPPGFDTVRDYVMVATDLGVIVGEQYRQWGRKKFHGKRKLLEHLYANEADRLALFAETRAAIEKEAGRG